MQKEKGKIYVASESFESTLLQFVLDKIPTNIWLEAVQTSLANNAVIKCC